MASERHAGGVVVVGVDDSPGAARALDWAVREAAVHGWDVHAVLAWELPSVGALGLDPLPTDVSAVAEGATAVLARILADVKPLADDLGVTVKGEAVHGHPRHTLLDLARDADLLVVGSRGHGGFAGLLLGSVSSYCAKHAPGPIVIVPASAEEGS